MVMMSATASPLVQPSRAAGLDRLANFAPRAGQAYALGRNTDPGPGKPTAVSQLSPYARYRLLTERDIVTAVLASHSLASAEKYVQEVLWRTYWKGWLELRPMVWSRFLEQRDRQRDGFADGRAITDAENGRTGIEGFDDWARQLVATGYLHNHARMWFASIWIFTLRLPWALGADFFLRHLIDADAASNTLSWRWVAGLQTVGKTYLATADNIARYTGGRFAPVGLAQEAFAITEPPVEAARALRVLPTLPRGQVSLLLVTHEDMTPESAFPADTEIAAAIAIADDRLLWGASARQFVAAATRDVAARVTTILGCEAQLATTLDPSTLIAAAQMAGVRQIATAYAPVGPVADTLANVAHQLADEGIALVQCRRAWDAELWPHAKRGFFPFKAHIPAYLRENGLA